MPVDWPGGVRHVGDVSPICCSRMERGKACPVNCRSLLFRAGGDRECPERLKPSGIEYLSGVCWRTGS